MSLALSSDIPLTSLLTFKERNDLAEAEFNKLCRTDPLHATGYTRTTTLIKAWFKQCSRPDFTQGLGPILSRREGEEGWEAIRSPALVVALQKRYPELTQRTDGVWKRLFEKAGYCRKEADEVLSWEECYFKERVCQAVRRCSGKLDSIPRTDWDLFYLNKDRICAFDLEGVNCLKAWKVMRLLTLFDNVTFFNMSDSCSIQKEEWPEILGQLKQARHVDVSNNWKVTTPALKALAKNAHAIETLNLSSISSSTEKKAVMEVLKNNPRLTHLRISELAGIEDPQALAELLSCCPQIKTLRLNFFDQLTFEGLNLALCQCPNLEKLVLGWCHKLVAADASKLSRHPQLRALTLIDFSKELHVDLGR